MSPESIVASIGAVIVIVTLVVFIVKRAPKKLKVTKYTKRWRELQRLCGQKETWPDAVVQADQLLDAALKQKKKPGQTMGERMVNASNQLSNKDAVWQAHKLAGKLEKPDAPTLKEQDVKGALVAFRQALKDLGAL